MVDLRRVWDPEADRDQTLGACQLNRRSLRRLQDGAWLNDELVNAWTALLKPRQAVVFSSFTLDYLLSATTPAEAEHRRTRTLRRQCGHFQQGATPLLLFPVNAAKHWVLVVASTATRQLYLYDSLEEDAAPFAAHVSAAIGLAKHFLGDGDKESVWRVVDPNSFSPEWRPGLQRNGHDCGLLLCLHAKAVALRKPVEQVAAHHSLIFRKLLLLSLLKGQLLF